MSLNTWRMSIVTYDVSLEDIAGQIGDTHNGLYKGCFAASWNSTK